MQIFSKLQRNSTYKTLIKILLIFLITSISALSPFFPILIGFFLLCEEFFIGIIYIGFFSVLHSVNIFFLLAVYLFLYFFLAKKIVDYFTAEYRDIVYLFSVYAALFLYFLLSGEKSLYYILFNYSFDILLVKVFKCELKLSY